ncbi:hypothetical protein [Lichenibacterium dinghuense]|uniref:hypothetical protein n=1 Tax=Lichenibacterium dinghuense TaxID=2895977 RepID=UPI001F4376A3|nr:hypothetical protein [Lichenibacterium sp. 6Y81]
MNDIKPGPHDRVITPDANGNLHFQAGDNKRRAAALAARRAADAESAAKRFSPDAMDAREVKLEQADRQRRQGAINDALAGVKRVENLRDELTKDRDEARASARNLVDIGEAGAALAEAAVYDRKLSQVPAALDAALSAVADAREALKRFDASTAARAADRAAAAEKRRANVEREAAARAAAEEVYQRLMAEPPPKPVAVRKKP